MSSEVCFTRETDGWKAAASIPLVCRERGGRYFFFWSPEVRRPLPAVRAGGLPSPPTLGRACSRRRGARPNHSSRHRWLRIRRGLLQSPGPERGHGAFDLCRPRPAGSPRLYLPPPPSLSGHRWATTPARGPLPRHPDPAPRGGLGSADPPEPTAAGAGDAAGGRPRGACRGGGVEHPVSAAPASPAQPHGPARTAPRRAGGRTALARAARADGDAGRAPARAAA